MLSGAMFYVVGAISALALAAYAIWARRMEKRAGPPSEPAGEPTKRFGLFTIFGGDGPKIPPGASGP